MKLAYPDHVNLRKPCTEIEKVHQPAGGRLLFCAIVIFVAVFSVSCEKAPTGGPAIPNVKRYQLAGRVVSLDKANKALDVDGDEIPGFMTAMEMPYSVRDAKLLEQVSPGDRIKADLVVASDGTYLENITVTTKGSGTATPPAK
jgi:protein SCO1